MAVLAIWAGLGMKQLPEPWQNLPGDEVYWLVPEPPQAEESFDAWCARLAAKIPPHTEFLGGFSLGGMIACEQAKAMPRLKGLVLLSFAPSRKYWRNYLNGLARSGILGLFLRLPARLVFQYGLPLMRVFGRKTFVTMNRALRYWNPEQTKTVLRWLLAFGSASISKPFLLVLGGKDPWLKSGAEAVLLPHAGHFLFPKHRHVVGQHVHSWMQLHA
ncbi:MAG: Serine aminopeptidase [Bacteroidota bacterium]|jgi:pimeloyl-ACP methyl ester carboxylesterase